MVIKWSFSIAIIRYRARHWCLPRCPGQVELVNYSCRASKNYLACPTGQACCLYFGFTFENVCGLASKLVLENMLSFASTIFYLVLNETL